MQRGNIISATFYQKLKYNITDENIRPDGASLNEMLKSCLYVNSSPTNLFISNSKFHKLTLPQLYSCFLRFVRKYPKINAFQECLFPFFCHIVMHFRLNEQLIDLNDFIKLNIATIPNPYREKVDQFINDDENYQKLSLSFSTQLYILRCRNDEYTILNDFLNLTENAELKRYLAQIVTIEKVQEVVDDKLPNFVFSNISPISNLNILKIKLNSFASIVLPELPSLFVSAYDSQICHIDASTHELQHLYSHSSFVTSMSLSSTSNLLLSTDLKGTAILYSNENNSGATKIKEENNLRRIEWHSQIWCSTFAPHGGYFALGYNDAVIRLYDSPTQKISRALVGHTQRIESLLFHPNCSLLASLSSDTALRIWDIRSAETCRLFTGEANRNSSLSISPNGKFVAFFDGKLKVCDIGKGEIFIDLQLNNVKSVVDTYFSSDSKILYVVGSDGVILYVDLVDNNHPQTEIYSFDSNIVSSRLLKSNDLVIVTNSETAK